MDGNNMDVNNSLITAVREGELKRTRELINTYGLSYSQAWSEGYVLLCDAVKYRHTAVAKLLLTSGANVNSRNTYPSNTPLHFACINGDIEIVKLLLDKGAHVNVEDKCGRSPLHNAVKNMKMKVTELLKTKAYVSARQNDGTNSRYVAVEYLQIVEHLINSEADVNCKCTGTWKKGYAPLHLAVAIGSKEVATLLLSRGAHVDIQGEDGITPLHIATKKGYINIAEDLLQHGALIDSFTLTALYTPLHFASELGNEEAVKLLLMKGADVNATTNGNLTPLHIATKTGHQIVVKLLLQHGAKVDNQDKNGKTTLHLAVDKGNLAIVEDVLRYCPDVHNPSNRRSLKIAVHGYGKAFQKISEALLKYGFTVDPEDANNPELLHVAVEKGVLKVVENLLKYGADVNTCHEGFTALHRAVKNKQEEVAKLLICCGADINAQEESGKTPIFYSIENADLKMTNLLLTNGASLKDSPDLLNIAVMKKCIEIVEALLQHGADINASDKDGRTALHTAIKKGNEKVVEALLKNNANVNSGTESGDTPLHLSALRGNEVISAMLLNNGANVNAKQKDGTTALHIATREGHKEIVKVLLEHGANVDSKSKGGGFTPLHFGAYEGNHKIIETILKFGADIDSRDRFGRTALHYAAQGRFDEVVVTLLEYGSDINIISEFNETPLDQAMTEINISVELNNYGPDNYDDDSDVDFGAYLCLESGREATIKALKRHIVKMKTANLYVIERNLQSMGRSGEISDFQDECEQEIARMKNENINCQNISFYDILAKGTSSFAIYMRNENIVQVLKSGDYKVDFPIYASMIENRFRKAMGRKELLEQGIKMFHFLFNQSPELPYVCTEQILSYLSNENLRNLMDACKPLNISTPNNISDTVISSSIPQVKEE